jgi:hypothetical protein
MNLQKNRNGDEEDVEVPARSVVCFDDKNENQSNEQRHNGDRCEPWQKVFLKPFHAVLENKPVSKR